MSIKPSSEGHPLKHHGELTILCGVSLTSLRQISLPSQVLHSLFPLQSCPDVTLGLIQNMEPGICVRADVPSPRDSVSRVQWRRGRKEKTCLLCCREGHTGLPGARDPLLEGSSGCTGLASIMNISSRTLGSAFRDMSTVEGLVVGTVGKANRTPATGSQTKA